MAVETGRTVEEDAAVDADRNAVAVEFADGTRRAYVVVIRTDDWLHAERLVGEGEGLEDEEIEAINPDAVRRIRSACVHVFDGGAVHHGEGLLADPDALLAEYGLD